MMCPCDLYPWGWTGLQGEEGLKKQTALVGFFVLFAVLGAVVFMHSVKKGITTSWYQVYALLPNADGLYNKSRVMIAGIVVGQIDKISLQGEKARVDLRIKLTIKLYKDASIAKVSTGLLGDYALVLRRGTPQTGFIGNGGQIKNIFQKDLFAKISKATPSILKLSKTLGDLSAGPAQQGRGALREVAESLKLLTRALTQSVKQNQNRISDIIRSVDQITRSLSRTTRTNMRHVSSIVKDIKAVTSNLKRISGQEQNVRLIIHDVRKLTKAFNKIVSGQVGPGAQNIRKTLAKLDKTMGQVQEISEKINKGKGTLGRLINDKKLIDKVEGVVVDVNALVKKVSLLKTNIRWRADYFFLHSRFRNDVRVLIQPNKTKYYSLSLIDDPRGSVSNIRRITRSTDPNQPSLINEEITEVRDNFRLSLQIHFRMWFAAIRGGIIENTGGVGLDVFLFRDLFKLRADFFEFSLETMPRLRLYATLQLWRFTIAAGTDDVLNGTRDFFVGAGLTFNDEDLKYLLTILPVPR